MDGDRFDDLSRRLAAVATRRATLTGAAAALLGAVGLRQAADAQVTQAQCGNKICANNPAVCNDGCVCCVYPNGNSRCRPPGTCSPGTAVCPPGEVADPVAGCVTTMTTTTSTTTTTTTTSTTTTAAPECVTATDCGDPCAVSCNGGTCSATPALVKGAPCGDGSACLDGSCQAVSGGCVDATRCVTEITCPAASCGVPSCEQTVEGAFVCNDFASSGPCSSYETCTVSADCDPGFVCIPDTCCANPICIQVCGAGDMNATAVTERRASPDGGSPLP